MELADLIAQLAALGPTQTGFGPKHPTAPQPQLQREIDAFFEQYPLLRRDQSYIDFLETYAAANVERPDESLSIYIYGFDSEMTTLYLPQPVESVIEQDGTFRFAEIALHLEPKRGNHIGIGFTYDLTGTRPAGVYRFTRFPEAEFDPSYFPQGVKFQSSENSWYCGTFKEWLELVIQHTGVLLV
jgi:hypothetical protein